MQMYFLCYATACLIVSSPISAPPRWSPDYDAAIDAARSAHRPLLLVLENGADAGARFELADVDGSSEEAELLTRFETCRLDVQTEEGRLIAAGYSVSEYPSILISDDGCERIVFHGTGQLSSTSWRQTLRNYAGRPRNPGQGTTAIAGTIREESHSAKPFQRTRLEEAQRDAHRRRRPLIVYVGTDNCPFCDKMRHETLDNRRVIEDVSADFETVSIETRDEPSWVEQQGLRLYPTTLVFGCDGELIDRMEGFIKPVDFLQRLQMSREYLLSTMW